MVRVPLTASLVIVVALVAAQAGAQSAGSRERITISGTVTDPSGAVLPGAMVEIMTDGRPPVVLTAGSDGRYRAEVASGMRYTLRAVLDGFADQVFELPPAAGNVSHDFVLQISLTESVVVTGVISQHLATPTPTASRLDLSPLQTPASVEIITGESMQVIADKTITAAASRATGIVNTSSAFGFQLNARGFNGNNSVMQLYDGMRMYVTTVTFPSDPWMADRIEVLRGPASVLYGEGAIGAAMNVVRKAPTRIRQTDVKFSGASFGTFGLGAGSGGPLSDRLSYRADVGLNRSSGWMERGDSTNTAMSGALRFDATERVRLTVTHDYTDANPTRWFGVPLVNGVFRPELRKRNYNVRDNDLHFKDTWTQFKGEWNPSASLTINSDSYYLTTNKHWRNAELQTGNAATGNVTLGSFLEIFYNQDQVGNRTTVRHNALVAGHENDAVIGVEFNHQNLERVDNAPFSGTATVNIDNPIPVSFVNVTGTVLKFTTRLSQYAAFAEDRFVIGPRWSLVGGMRVDRPTVERNDAITPAGSFTGTFGSASGRLGVVFNPRPNVSLYGQFATAADPITTIVTTNVTQKDFDVSTGRQWEAGLKEAFWRGRGEWTFAGYHIVKNRLLTRDVLDPAITVQIGQQSSRGVEGSLSLAVGGGLNLQANASFVRPRYDDFAESVGGVRISRNGNVPNDTARRSANFIALWHVGSKWTTNTAVRYVGSRFQDTANTRMIRAYTIVDATVQREAFRNGILGLTVRNLFDELYARNMYGSGIQWILGDPRTVELSLRLHF